MSVNHSAGAGGEIGISFRFSLTWWYVVCTTHRGDSNEYNKKKHPKLSRICSYMYGIFSKGLKNEFEAAVLNEPSVFEPLKFYCNDISKHSLSLAAMKMDCYMYM